MPCWGRWNAALDSLCLVLPKDLALVVLDYWGLRDACWMRHTHDWHGKDWFKCSECGATDWGMGVGLAGWVRL